MLNIMAMAVDFKKLGPWLPSFWEGTMVTIVLSFSTVLLGTVIGLFATIMQQSEKKWIRMIANAYTQIIRGTPMLLQLFLWLYGLPLFGITIPTVESFGSVYGSREFLTAVIALSVNSGAYICEIFRGGLEAIDKGQMEAGRALGLSRRQTLFSIIIPQATRVVLPGLGNEFITMIKESSIVSTIGVFDVMYVQNIVKAATYSIFEPLVLIGAIYFVLTFALTKLMKYAEKRLSAYD
ncbi:amino acid ABC transporter permease [Aerococcaceae bacterium zg-ZJ1578]|uniref:amino acid ABC transporter permease n=1 Tax=Aerococcaceae TaxID=186827 RepID=UPI0013BCB56B|nr:amino acid ABC transporter permease [Aerococcaceae bacterium zg-1578]MBR7927130.1 amino acid ABC transporter permease [Aerococcaceae bacterium zg-ZUI334]MBS4461924.1 amino acid ABC transporter permease [Aerococcaceae bacterium zg-B36]NEW63542.1 ABC transporter permease subunit [Facklamia sp. 252]NEW67013.1 ABC transporter permease subunit [Facklamia sp. 253]QQD66438.1 amino acid ABC transporter permease [Aerococcaceae bacterium zg-252]